MKLPRVLQCKCITGRGRGKKEGEWDGVCPQISQVVGISLEEAAATTAAAAAVSVFLL